MAAVPHLVVELEMQLAGGAGVGSHGLRVLDGQPAVQRVVRGQRAQRQRHVPDQWPPCAAPPAHPPATPRLAAGVLHQTPCHFTSDTLSAELPAVDSPLRL